MSLSITCTVSQVTAISIAFFVLTKDSIQTKDS